MGNFHYLIYGLGLTSDRPLPGLKTTSREGRTDITVHVGYPLARLTENADPPFIIRHRSHYEDGNGRPLLTISQQSDRSPFYWLYLDGTRFLIDERARQIWADWPEDESLENMTTYLLGPVLGFVLRLRGIPCLHASAIAYREQVIAMMGPPGAGKSTTATAFAQLGAAVMSEDVVTLKSDGTRIMVEPGYPGLRLWPSSVTAFFGSPDALPRITPTWDKRFLDLEEHGYRHCRNPLPLGAIYCLGPRENGTMKPTIDPLEGHLALIELVSNSYTNYALDKTMRREEFQLLGELLNHIRVRHLTPPGDLTHLRTLCQIILDDFETISSRKSS